MSMLFFTKALKAQDILEIPLPLLAHLGDAVFHVFERERLILTAASADEMHKRSAKRVNAVKQADLLDTLLPLLNAGEGDLIRRARNIKSASHKRIKQTIARKATAFEVLLGYLYLTDEIRLGRILAALHSDS